MAWDMSECARPVYRAMLSMAAARMTVMEECGPFTPPIVEEFRMPSADRPPLSRLGRHRMEGCLRGNGAAVTRAGALVVLDASEPVPLAYRAMLGTTATRRTPAENHGSPNSPAFASPVAPSCRTPSSNRSLLTRRRAAIARSISRAFSASSSVGAESLKVGQHRWECAPAMYSLRVFDRPLTFADDLAATRGSARAVSINPVVVAGPLQ
ncbi:hypothetical protein GGG16DRAFT_119363 [Schizophyllum commune]